MRQIAIVLALGIVAFAVTLAVYFGSHLSDEAISVLTGAACGVGAILPTVIVVGLSLLRRREREDVRAASPPQSLYPPVIVVAPPVAQSPSSPSPPYISTSVPVPRQFTVIGDDPLDSSTQQ